MAKFSREELMRFQYTREELDQVFPASIFTDNNGRRRIRRNTILLAALTHRPLYDYVAKLCKDYEGWTEADKFWHLMSMNELKSWVYAMLKDEYILKKTVGIEIMKYCLPTTTIALDSLKGICEDGDARAVRYQLTESGKIYKMKSGKFIRRILTESEFGACLPEQVLVWLQEEFAADWQANAGLGDYTLHVGDDVEDFEKIYDSGKCEGNFGSCMTNCDYHYFYSDYGLNCKAAWLENTNGKVVARCIIYYAKNVNNGVLWRLAERQYSTNGDESLKRKLVCALIAAGEIDGYKTVGADCHSPHNFVTVNGDSLRDMDFMCTIRLDRDSTVSYQDSFKWYAEGAIYNFEVDDYEAELCETSGNADWRANEWDSYHEYYCRSTVGVNVHGSWMHCDEDNLDDFVKVYGNYYHEDDVCECPECGELYVPGNGYYSDITDEEYCCGTCRRNAEQTFKEQHWYFSEFDQKYYEDKDDVLPAKRVRVNDNNSTLIDVSDTTIFIHTWERNKSLAPMRYFELNGTHYIFDSTISSIFNYDLALRAVKEDIRLAPSDSLSTLQNNND